MYQSIAALPANILVIDDTPENLELLAALLSSQGYKVRSVTKGSSGLRGAQAAPPDLILLDINMPQMDGYEVCRQLKADQRTRHIPVIFISALEDVLDKVQAFEVGGVDYITKPFQVEEVLARIETHLTAQLLQRQLQTQNLRLQQEIRDRQQAEEKFVKAFRASPSPIAITTLAENRLVEVNPSFLRISGYGEAELIDRSIVELGIAPDSYLRAVQLLLENGVLLNQECDFRTKTGEVKTVLLSLERIELAGSPCLLNIVNDITDRKRLENEFISLVSHELRTPLTSLVGALDLLVAGEIGTLTEQGQYILKIAAANTDRLMRLIDDILDLEQMKSGKISIRKSRCNVADLLALAAEAMQPMADRAQVKLVTEAIEATIWADGDRLMQALTNLLSNAIKFSEPNRSVSLSAQVKEADSAEASLLISVQDQGRGIPTDKLQLIFDRFQQVDVSDSRQKGGTGLGLAICRSIVEQHNGKIWVESVFGTGSTFYISLPIDQPERLESD